MLVVPPVLSYHRVSFRTPREAYDWAFAVRECLTGRSETAAAGSFIARPVIWAPIATGGSEDPAHIFVSDGALIAARGGGLRAATSGLVKLADLPEGLSLLVGADADRDAYAAAGA